MPQLVARNLTCECGAVDPAITVYADAEKPRQILLNLLSNAIKYTPSGGQISIGAAIEDRAVLIRVRDTGRGIAADTLETVFAPFVRLDTDSSRTTEGTGLGLAISRDLARKMGGDLTVESVFGQGSTFTLQLPVGRDLP